MRKELLTWFTISLFLVVSAGAMQTGPVETVESSSAALEASLTALGMAINTGGVFLLVALVTWYKPRLRERAPHWIPIIAMLAGPVLNGLAAAAADAFGWQLDFSPLIAAFAGPMAVAADQVRKQRRRIMPTSTRFPA